MPFVSAVTADLTQPDGDVAAVSPDVMISTGMADDVDRWHDSEFKFKYLLLFNNNYFHGMIIKDQINSK